LDLGRFQDAAVDNRGDPRIVVATRQARRIFWHALVNAYLERAKRRKILGIVNPCPTIEKTTTT
jgi:hypothetical protein